MVFCKVTRKGTISAFHPADLTAVNLCRRGLVLWPRNLPAFARGDLYGPHIRPIKQCIPPKAGREAFGSMAALWVAFPSSCRRGQRCCSGGVQWLCSLLPTSKKWGGRDPCRGPAAVAASPCRILHAPPPKSHYRRSSLGPVEWRSTWNWPLFIRLLVSNRCSVVLHQTKYSSLLLLPLHSVGCGAVLIESFLPVWAPHRCPTTALLQFIFFEYAMTLVAYPNFGCEKLRMNPRCGDWVNVGASRLVGSMGFLNVWELC